MAFQWSRFMRSTAGIDIVATIIISLFLFFPLFFFMFVFFSSVATFSHRKSARIKKLILRKLLRMPKKPRGRQNPSAIFGPPASHVGFCRQCGIASSERVPPSPLDWYSIYKKSTLVRRIYFLWLSLLYHLAALHESYQKFCMSWYISWEPKSAQEFMAT